MADRGRRTCRSIEAYGRQSSEQFRLSWQLEEGARGKDAGREPQSARCVGYANPPPHKSTVVGSVVQIVPWAMVSCGDLSEGSEQEDEEARRRAAQVPRRSGLFNSSSVKQSSLPLSLGVSGGEPNERSFGLAGRRHLASVPPAQLTQTRTGCE